jgi:phosphoglycolate phosphatase-like HAD superfamily hydrolase
MATHRSDSECDLSALTVRHDTFVAIDSDGCVFDTMEIKQCRFFHGAIIRHWRLEAAAAQVRAAAEFVNLTSCWRGSNRFTALLRMFELLAEWDDVRRTGAALPDLTPLRAYLASGVPLGNPSLGDAATRTGNPELKRTLEWSLAVNADIAANMPPVPPFAWARRSLDLIRARSDAIVVSQTPHEALVREWTDHGLTGLVQAISGQEVGSKSEQIRLATSGRYVPHRVLVIGDALGDWKAARETGALFYPICPRREEESWQRFHDGVYERFLAGQYAGEEERRLVETFQALLPEIPPWAGGPPRNGPGM